MPDDLQEAIQFWANRGMENGTGDKYYPMSVMIKCAVETKLDLSRVTWCDYLLQSALAAAGEQDPTFLKERLLRVAGLALAWREKLDRAARK